MSKSKVAPKNTVELGSSANLRGSLASLKFEDKAVTVEEQGATADYSSANRELRFMRKINKRECSAFIEKPNQDGGLNSQNAKSEDEWICMCGHPYSCHSKEAQNNLQPGVKWSYKEHSKIKPTDAFGEIEFVGYGDKVGKYVRVDVDTPIDTMLDLLQDAWGMEKPNLLISVTGGAKNFTMKPRLRDVFRKGLMKAALSTGAWIVTGGTAAGVMKHVGEAVRDFGLTSEGRVMTVGIAPWGCVQNRECLIDKDGKWPAQYRIEREVKKSQTFLDPNHTHFILVDDGTQQKFTVEIPFRAKLEEAIGAVKTDTGVDAVSVPVCLLVLEGGPGTLQTVHSALMSSTPTVIIKGSGKTADILAYAYQNAKEEKVTACDQEGNPVEKINTVLDAHVLSEITDMVKSHFGENNLSTRVGWVKDCCSNLDLITVFELDSKNSAKDVDLAILKALLKANKQQAMDQLKLALAWNRIDVAKSEIFTDERRWPTGMLDEVMMSAIQLNRVDFVELFLDNGVSLKDFLTIKRLITLYKEVPKDTVLYTLLQRTKPKNSKLVSMRDVGNLIQFLLGDFYQPHYLTDSRLRDIDTDALFGHVDGPGVKQAIALTQPTSSTAASYAYADPSKGSDIDFSRPAQELFIWAVLMNHLKLSKVFWREGKEATAAALFARSILLAMKNFGVSSEVKRGFQNSADEYGSLAVGVINTCYRMDQRKTLDLLVRDMPHWGCSTCVLLAAHSDNRDFISQTAVKILLNHIWKGNLHIDTSGWRSTLCTILFPLIPFLIKFAEEGPQMRENTRGLPLIDDTNDKTKRPTVPERQKSNLNPTSQAKASNGDNTQPTAHQSQKYNGFQKILLFYRSPVAKFNLHVLSYVAFLILYAYVLVVKLERTFHIEEGILIAYVGTFFIEEIRQMVFSYAKSFKTKVKAYLHDKLNILDIFSVLLFTVGMVFRFIDGEDYLWAARVILSINFIGFFFRILHIFYRFERLGPLVVMISEMVKDMLWFVIILGVFVTSYAIASEAVLYPNSELNWKLFFYAPRKAYWAIYSEFLLDEIEGGAACTNDPTKYNDYSELRCPSGVGMYFVPILLGCYVLMTNVLLLNLLIAMFSNTFQRIRDEAEKHWSFLLFSVVNEYCRSPVLPPPFIIFSHLVMAVRCKKCTYMSTRKISFRKRYSEGSKLEEKQLIQWENVIADNFLTASERKEANTVAGRVKSSTDRLEMILSKVDELQENQHQGSSGGIPGLLPALTDGAVARVPEQVQKRLDNMEAQLVCTMQALDWIMKSLEENKLNSKERKPYVPDLARQKQEEDRKKKAKGEREKQLVHDLMTKKIQCHYKSRISPYHNTNVARFPVPDEKVFWEIDFPEYDPPTYTSIHILEKPYFADEDLMALSVEARKTAITFNTYDKKNKVSRVSNVDRYEIIEGLPINPKGRTGLRGRGDLGRWGPNHAGDPIVTRWKYLADGSCAIEGDKPVLEFVAIQRRDNGTWAIPGGICHPEEEPWHTLKTDFKEETAGDLVKDEAKRKEIQEKLDDLAKHGILIYKGYADDPRNTDNAWLETKVINYHDESGTILRHYNLRAGGDAEAVSWQKVSSTLPLHGSHSYFLKLVAEKHNAAF